MDKKIILPVLLVGFAVVVIGAVVSRDGVPSSRERDSDEASVEQQDSPPAPKPPMNSGAIPPASITTPPPPARRQGPLLPPKTPTNFAVTAVDSSRVKLRWKSVDAPLVDGFHITRSTRADFADGKVIELLPALDTEPFFFTSYDATVVPGSVYWYLVTAYNAGGDSPATPPISVTVPSLGGSAMPNPVSVTVSGFAFLPQTLTVARGTKVTWTNLDSVAHTVSGDTAQGPTSALMPEGTTYSYTFATPGIYSYHCAPHPSMTGTVTVTE